MSNSIAQLPLFSGISEAGVSGLVAIFDKVAAEPGQVLFRAGDRAQALYILIEGTVALHEEGEERIFVEATSPIGELGAMSGVARRVTAKAETGAVVLRATTDKLTTYFQSHGDVAVPFYQNLLGMVADKVRRDERRTNGMRSNIISTQKRLKSVRDMILEMPATDLSEPVHNALEELIAQNRRANYVVEPPAVLPASVRLPDGQVFPVEQMSRKFIILPPEAKGAGQEWRAVLVLPDTEIPIGGEMIEETHACRVVLDFMIEEYSTRLENYLTRAQLLDIVL